MSLTKQFNKFAGKEVMVTETPWKRRIFGEDFEGVNPKIDENDPVIADLTTAAKKAGLSVRIWLPGTMGTMDYDTTRLNVHVAKEDDGKYRIQRDFKLG